jgi:hypothetical protein
MRLATNNEICPVCRQPSYRPFFQLDDVPVQDGVLWNSQAEAFGAPTGTIKLAFCHECGYVGNLCFQPEKIRYDQEYSFSLHFSPTYRAFVDEVATRVINRYKLADRPVMEIGCGQGDFLRLLSQLGCRGGVGIDPSVTPHEETVGTSHLTFLQDWYSERHPVQETSFLCCRHLLDQIADPRAFVELLRRNIGPYTDSVVYCEIPNAANIFEELLIRNIIYEKPSWFTAYSLRKLFQQAGFEVLSAEPCFEGNQYLGIEARPLSGRTNGHGNGAESKQQEECEQERFAWSILAFGENYQRKITTWRRQVAAIREQGQRAVAWGSGSGAITFLNTLRIKEEMPYVVDINPKRQGKFLPLTGQQVVDPAFLTDYRPQMIIITNATYAAEIKQQVGAMGIQAEFMVI